MAFDNRSKLVSNTAYIGTADGKFINFDAVLAETHNISATTTDHPIEKGGKISDHVIVDPVEVEFEVMVSNQPIGTTDLFGQEVGISGKPYKLDFKPYDAPLSITPGSIYQKIGGAIKSIFSGTPEYIANVLVFNREITPITDVKAALWKLFEDKKLVTVYTANALYKNMVLITAPMSRTPDIGDAARFHLIFKQIRVVDTASTEIPAEIIAQKPKDKGPKAPEETKPTKSVAKGLLDAAAGKL